VSRDEQCDRDIGSELESDAKNGLRACLQRTQGKKSKVKVGYIIVRFKA